LKSAQGRQCMDLEHRLRWLHFGARAPVPYCLHWLHLQPTHQYYTVYTGCTWSPLTSTILSALGTLAAHSPVPYCLHWLHLEPTH
jgi:hypothetical protein